MLAVHPADAIDDDYTAPIEDKKILNVAEHLSTMFKVPQSKLPNAAPTFTWNSDSPPSAIFIGGTSGVGEAMVRAFAQYTKGKADIAIVGRNKEAGQRILSRLPQPEDSGSKRVFIQSDVSLMLNVASTAQQLISTFSKINYLILSTGFLDLAERKETSEGLEYRLAVSYYSRWLFIRELIGLVEKAKENGEPAAVLSILAPGYGGEINQEDWELRRDYSSMKAMASSATYNDLMVESFAERHPTIPFIHAHPGMVRTPIFWKSPSLAFKLTGLILFTIGRPFSISAEASSESMWNIILTVVNEKENGQSYRMDRYGRNLKNNYFGNEENREGLWEHTESAISRTLIMQH